MSVHPHERELHKHFDGELSAREGWEIQAHLRECPTCAEAYRGIGEIVDAVGELPESVEPPVDLWPSIAARLGQPSRDELLEKRRRRERAVRTAVIVGWLGAVAAALVLGVGLGRVLPRPDLSLPAVAANPMPSTEVTQAAVLATYEEPAYDQAIQDLELVLAEMRSELEPETVAIVEQNLAIIDNAIEEAREALLADPANQQLHRHLSNSMQMKLKLLRTVTTAVTATT